MTFLEYFKNLQQRVYVTVAQLESGMGVLDSGNIVLPSEFGRRIYGAFFRYSYPAPQFSYFSIGQNIIDDQTAATTVMNIFDFGLQNNNTEQNIEAMNKIAVALFNVRGNKTYDLTNNLEYANKTYNLTNNPEYVNKTLFSFRNISLSDYQSSYLKIPIAYKRDDNEIVSYLDSILISFYYSVDMEYYSYYERQPSGSGILFIWGKIIDELMSELKSQRGNNAPTQGFSNSPNSPTNSKVINIASTANYKGYHRISFDVFATKEVPTDNIQNTNNNSDRKYIRYKYEVGTGPEEDVFIIGSSNELERVDEALFIKAVGDEILLKNVGENNRCLTFYNYAYNKYEENEIHYVKEKFFSYRIIEVYYINIFPIFEMCIEGNDYIKANGDIKYTSIKLIGESSSLYVFATGQNYLNFYTGISLHPDFYPTMSSLNVFDQTVTSSPVYQPPQTPSRPPGGPIRPPVLPEITQVSSVEA